MKIALVIWELNLKGGTQRLALEEARGLKAAGHTVDIYCYYYDGKQGYTDLTKDLAIYSVESVEIKALKGTPSNISIYSKLYLF
jgi:hypothetical protein